MRIFTYSPFGTPHRVSAFLTLKALLDERTDLTHWLTVVQLLQRLARRERSTSAMGRAWQKVSVTRETDWQAHVMTLSQQSVFLQLPVEIPLADPQCARGIASMAVAGFQRAAYVHQLQFHQGGQASAIHR